jgi:Cdc6-like AAA superfamily ATPase
MTSGSMEENRIPQPMRPIPVPSAIFTGRQSILQKLDKFFSPRPSGSQKRRTFVLYGMGGAGKTQTALKFVEDHGARCVLQIDQLMGRRPLTA